VALDGKDAELLYTLQTGLPLERRPFARVGAGLGLSEQEVLDRLRAFFERGQARRLGGVFDPAGLGYRSTLCAAALGEDELPRIVPLLTPHPGMTHCYLRKRLDALGPAAPQVPNLWFTLTVPAGALDAEVEKTRRLVAPRELLDLPARRRFKVQVIFDPREERATGAAAPQREAAQPEGSPTPLAEWQKAVVRALQGNLPLVEEPFAPVAEAAGCGPDELLGLLREWHRAGVLRRVALLVRHRRIGFTGNAIAAWAVPAERVEPVGLMLAARRPVTHCYERRPHAAFPPNLYAMLHARGDERVREMFRELSAEAGLSQGVLLRSVREYKKTSLRYF